MKKLEIEKTRPTFIISVLKVEYQVILVSSISNFFTSKWMREKIPTCSNSALAAALVHPSVAIAILTRLLL